MADAAEGLRARQRRYLFPCVSTYYREPLVLVQGEGCRVRDAEGREYLDLFAGILTTSVGHAHPEVVQAVAEQAARLGHCSTLYVNEPQVEVAERLARLAPGELRRCFFTNSGSEAIETAVMLACMATGRSEIITLRHAYSGRSTLASQLTAHAPWRPLASSVAGIKHVQAPYPYRAPMAAADERALTDYYLRDLEEAIETTTNGRPAAFLAETILGVGGVIVPPAGYLAGAAELIRRYGGVFISDEVQTGFGRCGDVWFGIEQEGVVPDILVAAKGIANGVPAAVTITTDEIASAWTAKTISTFGGNPLSMAAARATLRVLERERAPANAARQGARMRAGLEALAARHEWIGEVRGRGLMLGMELVTDRQTRAPAPARATALLEAARAEGVLVGLGGLRGQVVRIGPSLLIGEAEVDEGLERLARACARVQRQAAE